VQLVEQPVELSATVPGDEIEPRAEGLEATSDLSDSELVDLPSLEFRDAASV
jgi:hypothetical protein